MFLLKLLLIYFLIWRMAMKDEKGLTIHVIKPIKSESTENSEYQLNRIKKSIRVAAYCRVSTMLEMQATSYEKQVMVYKKLIENHSNWILAGIYADEGKSGTTRQKRTDFNRMMQDALSGKIDYIITKSISRFARNQKDMLECITLLKEHDPPIGVFFEEENLDSLDKSKEFIFSILSMVAQDQSRSISENVKWAVQKSFRAGQALIDPSQLLGYTKGKSGEWVIVPEQANTVKFIFKQFLECGNASQVARALNEKGVKTNLGNDWSYSAVYGILRNEKYVGDIENQKTYSPDYLTHKTVRNTGQKTKFYVVDHHVPIVSREMWNRVQEKMKEVTRGAPKTTKMAQMKKHSIRIKAFSCLKCGILKKDKITFHRTISRTNRGDSAVYVCCRKKYKERPLKKCEDCAGRLSEFTIEQSFMEMLYKCKKEIEFHNSQLKRKFRAVYNKRKQKQNSEELLLEIAELEEELRTLRDCRRRIKEQYDIQYSIRYFAGANTCMEIINGIDKSINNAEKQKIAGIRQLEEMEQLQNQYNAFVEDILNLPELNMAGIRLNVFGRDVFSTEKSVAHSRKKVTPDIISKAPDWLDFSQNLFEQYVEWGEVKKNKIVYHTTFGVTIEAHNMNRGIMNYIGYRYVKSDGTIGCIRNTQVIYDELLLRNS